ncbi:beta-2-microglobulin-like [Stigmatopora nigra]
MKLATTILFLFTLCLLKVDSKIQFPTVNVYSHLPGQFGQPNTLICHVSHFHPPDISIELMKNGKEMRDAIESDLSFEKTWQFHLTKHVQFTPSKDDQYACRVTHSTTPSKYIDWDSNM